MYQRAPPFVAMGRILARCCLKAPGLCVGGNFRLPGLYGMNGPWTRSAEFFSSVSDRTFEGGVDGGEGEPKRVLSCLSKPKEVVEFFAALLPTEGEDSFTEELEDNRKALQALRRIKGSSSQLVSCLLIFDVAGEYLWGFNSLEHLEDRLVTGHGIPNVQARYIAKEVENIKSK